MKKQGRLGEWIVWYWDKYKPALICITIVLGLAVLVLLGYGRDRLSEYRSNNSPQAKKEQAMREEMAKKPDFALEGAEEICYFPVTVEGIDGENFTYTVYFSEVPEEESLNSMNSGLAQAFSKYNSSGRGAAAYMGPLEMESGTVYTLYLDLGSAPDDQLVTEVLRVLGGYEGIDRVIINEGGGFE